MTVENNPIIPNIIFHSGSSNTYNTCTLSCFRSAKWLAGIRWNKAHKTRNYHQLSSIIISYHQLSSIIINYHQLSSIIINYHQSSSIIINYHQLSSIISYLYFISTFKDIFFGSVALPTGRYLVSLPNSDAVLRLKPGNAILRAGTCVRILAQELQTWRFPGGTPKSSIYSWDFPLIINHPFWGAHIFRKPLTSTKKETLLQGWVDFDGLIVMRIASQKWSFSGPVVSLPTGSVGSSQKASMVGKAWMDRSVRMDDRRYYTIL